MKKRFVVILSVIMVIGMFPLYSSAENGVPYAVWSDTDKSLVFCVGTLSSEGVIRTDGSVVSGDQYFTDFMETPTWGSILNVLETVVFKDRISPNNTAKWFYSAQKLQTITGLTMLDTSHVTSMYAMFSSCSTLKKLDLSSFDTSNVTNMRAMFECCYNIQELDLSTFDTSNVADMSFMFNGMGAQKLILGNNFSFIGTEAYLQNPRLSFDLLDIYTGYWVKVGDIATHYSGTELMQLFNGETMAGMYAWEPIENDISNANCFCVDSFYYSGEPISPSVGVMMGVLLKKNEDYTVEFLNNDRIGTATIVVKGIGVYVGELRGSFEILCPHERWTSLNYNQTHDQYYEYSSAGCFSAGYSYEGGICNICGEDVGFYYEIPAYGSHEWDRGTVTKTATCTTKGEMKYTCIREKGYSNMWEGSFWTCGATKTEPIDIDPSNHDNYGTTVVRAVSATCTEPGYSGDTICNGCKAILTAGETINPKNHEWGVWADTGNGTHTRVCGNDADHVETVAHEWNDGEVTKAATCKEQGTRLFTCTECDATKTEVIEINSTNHADYGTEVINDVPASCTEHGYTGDTVCKGCKAVLSAGETINPKNHNWGVWTDAGNGKHTRVCGNDADHVETCAHTPGSPVETVVKAPTCTEEGAKKTTVSCTACGVILSEEYAVMEKIPHKDADNDGVCDDCRLTIDEDLAAHSGSGRCVCGKYHTGPFALIRYFFHRIAYFFKNLFK